LYRSTKFALPKLHAIARAVFFRLKANDFVAGLSVFGID
jgi:hypothetical protein